MEVTKSNKRRWAEITGSFWDKHAKPFFPGMGSKAPRTLSEDNWLPEDLGENVRVLAPSYDSCIVRCGNQGNTDDVSEIGRNILQILVISNRWRLGQRYGFVMIGHCFGGLVIKSLMEEAQKRSVMTPRNNLDIKAVAFATKFLQNLKGVVFYAVPHLGSELKSYFTQFNSTRFGVKWAGILQNLRSHQSRMADLSQSCDNIISQFSINVFAFLEGTTIPNMDCKLVEKPGARCHARWNYYLLEDCDHFNVCKPPDKKHPSYEMLLTVIKDCREQKIYVGRPSWQFCYFVESRLVPMLQENLLDVVSKRILVHGNLGCGKTSLVEYVIQRYAEDLLNRFSGGIYKLQYGTDDCDNIKLLTSQKGLLRELTPADHEIESMSIATVRSKLQRQLKMCPGPWLLFIDDVWSVKSISWSPEPIGDSCKLVLTSRFELKDWPATRIKIDEESNRDIAAQLLASKAAGDPLVTEFPPGCEGVARRLLANCSGCLLAVRILGTALSEVQKTPQEWAKVEMQFESYLDESRLIPDDYESKSLYAAISLSLYYGRDKASSIGMENVLRALALFLLRGSFLVLNHQLPMVELAWNCLQPQGAIGCFHVFWKDLVWKGLVEELRNLGYIHIPNLVRSFVAVKLEGVNLRTIALKGEVWRDALVFILVLFGAGQVRQDAISLFNPLLGCDAESYLSELFTQMDVMRKNPRRKNRLVIIDHEKAQLSSTWSDFHVKIRTLADANRQMPEECYCRNCLVDLFNLLLLETWIKKRWRIDNEQEVANVLCLVRECIGEYKSEQLHPLSIHQKGDISFHWMH
ncbi:hypothetical protein CY35_12G054900 [Sphagnum magellanicum]|nr:hypothetical protein CY35_12G054900 [Sphagnum magellanicum]